MEFLTDHGCPVLTEKSRFKCLQDFTKEICEETKVHKGTRVFKKKDGDKSEEDERYEILLYLRLFLKDQLMTNNELVA